MLSLLKIPFKTLLLSQPYPFLLEVILNRPAVLNAINEDMMADLLQLWHALYLPDKRIRCILLTGQGNRAFCAGADLKVRQKIDLTTWREHHAILQQAMLAMSNCPTPIIAAVNGVAFGGGLELILASDFAYAVENAIFAQSEVKVGLMPGAMGTQNLPRACGLKRAKELALTGQTFNASQAYEWGIINQICQADTLMTQVLATIQKIIRNAPFAVQQTKKALNQSQNLDLKSGYNYEIEAYNRVLDSPNRIEGIKAFNEKRAPLFLEE